MTDHDPKRQLTHLDRAGQARMVEVAHKPVTERVAVASGRVHTRPDVVQLVQSGAAAKGDVLAVARVAGIMAAKRTAELIPLCHPLQLSSVDVAFEPGESAIGVRVTVRCVGRTGVEMEALTGASVACLTIYDMCKAVDRAMSIEAVQLERKSGGKSGDFVRPEQGR